MRHISTVMAVLVVAVTLHGFALITSLAALAVALFALWQSRTAIRTVHEEVIPTLRALTGDEPEEGT